MPLKIPMIAMITKSSIRVIPFLKSIGKVIHI